MDLVIDAVLIVIIAVLFDLIIGELPNPIHPLRWMGSILYFFDKHISRKNRAFTIFLGLLSFIIIFVLYGTAMFVILALVHEYTFEWVWIIVSALMFKMTFAVSSFRRHVTPIKKELENGNVEAAAKKVQMIVSRNTEGMDAEHIASSCTETTSENYVDSVVSPNLYFGIFGIIGGLFLRCANLMDAMWGYNNEKYANLGLFVAKLDDVLGFIPARLSPIFITIGAFLLRMNWRSVIPSSLKEHKKTPSPNSGWPMTAFCAALGISMEKKGVYVMGEGALPDFKDITRCCLLLEVSSIIFIFAVALPLYAFVGINLQIGMENLLLQILGLQ